MRPRLIIVASWLSLLLLTLLALAWMLTGRQNAMLEAAFASIFLVLRFQHERDVMRGRSE